MESTQQERVKSCGEEILDVLEKYDCKITQSFAVGEIAQSVYVVINIAPAGAIFAGKTSRDDRVSRGIRVLSGARIG